MVLHLAAIITSCVGITSCGVTPVRACARACMVYLPYTLRPSYLLFYQNLVIPMIYSEVIIILLLYIYWWSEEYDQVHMQSK